jgi:hypothetical protein
VCGLVAKMAKLVAQRKKQLVFLINNYEMVLTVLREAAADADDPGYAGADRCATAMFFNEQLGAQLHQLVEEELADQFNPLVTFVKRAEAAYKQAEAQGAPRAVLPQFGAEDAEPVLRDFSMSWKMSIDEIHRSIVASFGNSQRALDILQRTLSQARVSPWPPCGKPLHRTPVCLLTHALRRPCSYCCSTRASPARRACWPHTAVPRALRCAETRCPPPRF